MKKHLEILYKDMSGNCHTFVLQTEDLDLGDHSKFINSLKHNGWGATVEIKPITIEPPSPVLGVPAIDVFIYDEQLRVTNDTIRVFLELLPSAGISRPLLTISELRRTYQ